MRTITAQQISDAVAALCVRANKELPEDIVRAMRFAAAEEPWPLAKSTLGVLCENIDAAAERNLPVCQDTGLACVFAELGQDEQGILPRPSTKVSAGAMRKAICERAWCAIRCAG